MKQNVVPVVVNHLIVNRATLPNVSVTAFHSLRLKKSILEANTRAAFAANACSR